LALLSLAQLMVVLDATVANIALPFIGADLDIGGADLTWIVSGYALVFGGLLLLGGRLADLYGRRRIFMVGLSVFAGASLLGGLASQAWMLYAARGLQGLGAALASPASLALITSTFRAGKERNQALAVYAAMSGVGAALGLILGGWLTGMDSVFGVDVDGWRLTLLINVPIGLGGALASLRLLPRSERYRSVLDVPGAITATFGLLGIVFGLNRAAQGDFGWGHGQTIGALTAGAVLMVVFILIELRAEHPLLPFRVFASKTRAASYAGMMLLPGAMLAMFFFLSLYIQSVMGYGPLKAGAAFLPFSVGIMLVAGALTALVSKVDPRYPVTLGVLMCAAGLFGLSRLSVDDSAAGVMQTVGAGDFLGENVNYWTQILPYISLMALGMGTVFVTLTLTAMHRLEPEDHGVGSGVLNTVQQVGSAMGLAVLGTVSAHFADIHAEKITPDLLNALGTKDGLEPLAAIGSLPAGATHAFLTATLILLACAVVVATLLDVKHTELATETEMVDEVEATTLEVESA
jgi:EmrB/QacA subfamily drug resistance transporter